MNCKKKTIKIGCNNMKKLLDLFKQPTPLQVIATELAQAHLSKLEAETAAEYAQSVVSYNVSRIDRLNKRREEYK